MNDLKFSRHVGVNQGQVPTFMSYLKKKKKSGSTVRVEYITIFGADSEVFFILTSGYIVSLSSLNIILIVLQPFLYGCQTMENCMMLYLVFNINTYRLNICNGKILNLQRFRSVCVITLK